ncbi:hypothetical protein [Massilia sp. H6]|uniref:hypothetical protein n=1 Tax=Massilia sp. H6 TaxID=2970464 RepID=UPI002167A33D|nr:hypothetical protein [Massilia sp. H6]UVW30707.1 hypothetical protein NRS07_19920 [Massilia sp. H6]
MIKFLAMSSTLTLLLCACGGGGSSSQNAAPVQIGNTAPPVTSVPTPPINAPAESITLGGTVSASYGDGLQLMLGDETISVSANATNFMFSTKLTEGNSYVVSIARQPLGAKICSLQNGAGKVGKMNISDINVICRSTKAMATEFASVYTPHGVVLDPFGTVYVTSGNALRKISANGAVELIGVAHGFGGYVDGAPSIARFNSPMGLASDSKGNIYVADSGNNVIRKIDLAGNVSTLAGSTQAGADNGSASIASFRGPRSVAVDLAGTVYVADTGNYMIRKVMPDGTVLAFAGMGMPGSRDGTGINAMFGAVEGIATDKNGNVWLADTSNRLIRKISAEGVVTTIAGKVTVDSSPDVDGYATEARFHFPMALAVDSEGYVFVTGNGFLRQIGPDGLVSTYTIAGTPGYRDGFAPPTPFTTSRGITIDKQGNIYITEGNLDIIRKIVPY